ncbi:dna (cytosine-5-)-methyltransferase [Fusarium heterosporum]|uniref:DNA (cytosine-5-)-methyltransferase n=1 Tax=Fusarium heterosporum TaxID=42747 RepID=A0A8H5WFP3_FUSHE|nr:dna (cytosine-5-)-methyltransferase [Fusarium heterosporum]
MPVTYIDLDPEESGEFSLLPGRPNGFSERRRRLSSCTIGGDLGKLDRAPEEVIDLTADPGTADHRTLEQGEFALEKIRLLGANIQAGSFLEIREFLSGKYLVEFILVKVVVRCRSSNDIKIRGMPFTRARSTLGKLPRKSNEVCMLINYNKDNEPHHEELVDISPSDVIQLYPLIVTNATHPKYNRCVFNPSYPEERGQPNRHRKKQVEEAMVRIHSSEVHDKKYMVSEDVLRNRWRGTTIKGGSWVPSLVTHNHSIDLDTEEDHNKNNEKARSHGQKYTMFDTCSGAGGVSRGASMAGFKVQYAVDKAPEVWETYQSNFPDTELFQKSIDEFVSNTAHFNTTHMRVDVLHFSPPCQFFSPAHTHASARDDENIDALFGCNPLLYKLRPRIVTVEQTFGLTHGRHENYFNTFLAEFTQYGYSVCWKVVRLCTWGAAQDRKRLIIIAAAPGERLPPFPKATHRHGEDDRPGLLPCNTIRKALRGIRPGDDLHDLDNVQFFNPRRAPYDPDRLAGTITTGSDLCYPDGSRKLTLRELASLQGFPKTHQFFGTRTSIKRQIGNAFPPNTVRVLYKHIEQWLLNEDGIMPAPDHAILVEDDSDTPTDITDDSEDEPRYSPDMMEVDVRHSRNRGTRGVGSMIIDLT